MVIKITPQYLNKCCGVGGCSYSKAKWRSLLKVFLESPENLFLQKKGSLVPLKALPEAKL
jgi:hypothetical protein